MARTVNNALRVAVVTEWRQAKGSMCQRDFIARASERHGIELTARTLRSWCRELDLARPDHQLEPLRRLATDALDRVRAVEAELAYLLGSLDATRAAAISTPSSDERQPLNVSAADASVDPARTTGGAPQLDADPLNPAMPPSKDAPGPISSIQEPTTKFVWDLEDL